MFPLHPEFLHVNCFFDHDVSGEENLLQDLTGENSKEVKIFIHVTHRAEIYPENENEVIMSSPVRQKDVFVR